MRQLRLWVYLTHLSENATEQTHSHLIENLPKKMKMVKEKQHCKQRLIVNSLE